MTNYRIMKNCYRYLTPFLLTILLLPATAHAGNKQRTGEAGASELLINPWAKSTGWGEAGIGVVQGLEAFYLNVAGTYFIENATEIGFAHTQWLVGSGVSVNSFGFAHKPGGKEGPGVLSVHVMTVGFGDIEQTTVLMPEGGLGTYSPNYFNIGISYAKRFSDRIFGGGVVKVVNQSIPDLTATTICFDGGIQYHLDRFKFGVTLKNVGVPLKYSGDGMSFRGSDQDIGVIMTAKYRSASFELPTLIKIGLAYDFILGEPSAEYKEDEELNERNRNTIKHLLTPAGTFTANAFSKDQFHFGLQYRYLFDNGHMMYLRTGYIYESGVLGLVDDDNRVTAYTGPTFGFSFDFNALEKKDPDGQPIGESSRITLDYSYRTSNPFGGTHTIGLMINI